jgi:hypothetical protein
VRFVDEDRESPPTVLAAHLLEDERELLHRRDDDLLTVGDEIPKVARMLGVADRRAHLRELLDGIADLLVEDLAVGDDDDRVEGRCRILRETDELVREPRDGVRLAAPGRVLDQVPATGASLLGVREEAVNDVELMVARPDLSLLRLPSFLILGLDDLRVVLEDVSEAGPSEDLLPEVVGLEAARVRWISPAVVPTAVERKEPGVLALEMRAEADLVIVDGKVDDATSELEELFARVAVVLVLLDGVLNGLLGQTVLQLERGNGQSVDE